MHAAQQRETGAIVRTAIAVYRRHFTVLFVTAAVLGVPAALVGLVVPAVPETGGEIALLLAASVVDVLAAVVAIVQVVTVLRGGEPTLSGGVTAGMRRLLPALGALGMSTVWILAVAALAGAVLGGIWVTTPRDDPRVTALVGAVLLLLFLVPVTLVMLRYFAVLPVAVLEPGVPALHRSAELARGAYWKMGVLGLVGWLVWAPALILPWADAATTAALQLASWLTAALAVPFSAGLVTLFYDDQRARKDEFP